MMETITLSTADNPNSRHVAAGGLEDHHHHQHSPVDEEQIMNLSDMADLAMQEDIVALPKEVILISLVSQEQALYNPKHENYRNTKRKDQKWLEIAENLGWTEMQCKAKWKAMRDQYCRELKRSKFNTKANIRWRYFKELDFLRPYALARNYRPRNPAPINNNTSNNINNQNSFNCASTPDDNMNHSDSNNTKFESIKIESNATGSFAPCDFSTVKTETATNLTEEQLNSVLQHQSDDNNWTYITTASSTSSNNNSRLDNHPLSDTTHLLSTHSHHHQQQQTDEALYNALVSCVGQIQQQQHQLCQQQQQHHQQELSQTTSSGQQQPSMPAATKSIKDEEDDDPIHTFLNIESYFEKELIAMIQHEDVLYNSYHPNYRNVKLKLEVWDEIARKLKKTVKQCRLKWKALRDQFIREHKRLKYRDNVESLPRWKHYDALSFLQKFIKQRPGDFENKSLLQIPKSDIDGDMDDDEDEHMNISDSSPLDKCEMNQNQLQLPDLEAVNQTQSLHQQQAEHTDGLCVTSDSVGGYDDMDIDNYIMGDSDSVVDDHNHHDHEGEEQEDHKSQEDFSVYHTNHSADKVNMHSTNLDTSNQQAFNTSTSPQTLQTSTSVAEQHQHINMPSLDLNDSSGNLIAPDNLKNAVVTSMQQSTSYQTSNLTNGSTLSLTPTQEMCSSSYHATATSNNTPSQLLTTSEASTNTPQPSPCNANHTTTTSSSNAVNSDDDEVGAFFKAVAMKIRNAKLSPVAFTDLQIDILKVINCSLRNH
ncbi:probable basic-leucine zipper transcription factor C [Musca domestica]|uniref:Probable basic-leucine zipper transcription factor C n=1 Tax=Musca domestica TaxID=7370 RepID=A0ABM3URU2_MUSDO|nr:probable basic-leucine zipper transcription factor C [Musca domestica]